MKKTLTKHPTKTKNSLFEYVLHHLNENGWYDASSLPDHPDHPYTWGNDDAETFSPSLAELSDGAVEEIIAMLKRWQDIPSARNKKDLYEFMKDAPMVVLFGLLSKKMLQQKLSFDLVKLADEWLHTSPDREIVKFSYLICGVIGLDKIRTLYSRQLYEDLFTMALCEEFTLYLCLACHISHIRPQQKIWYLLRHTCGWGRALALALADYKTDRQQTWLLAHGLELRIFWPPLAPLIIIESLLIKRLQVESCSEKFYKQVVQVVIQYLLFLSPVEDEPEYKFGTFVPQQFNIDLADLLSNLLRLSVPFVVKPSYAVNILAIRDRLQEIVENASWDLLNPNTCNTLISTCDQLIYSRDWEPIITKKLFTTKGELDTDVAELAAGINVDVWERVFNFLQQHPTDPAALSFCLHAYPEGNPAETPYPVLDRERMHELFEFISRNELTFINDEESLLLVLTFVHEHPGRGASLLILALTCLSDAARGLAAMSLDRWDPNLITPAIRMAVLKALHLNKSPFIKMILSHILNPDSDDDLLHLN
ncbi:MAG: hypothetical protein LKF34_06920 [Acidaminococcaceae bacterium]|jgi:hypothetical protein|nr:hypothetical protein [Acidaminococcaceae bacterium]